MHSLIILIIMIHNYDPFERVPELSKGPLQPVFFLELKEKKGTIQSIKFKNTEAKAKQDHQNESQKSTENEDIREILSILDDYFKKELPHNRNRIQEINLNPFSHLNTEFQKSVMHKVAEIPFGARKTYKDVGLEIGSRGYRAIGSVVAKNKFPLIIPCHRVVGKNSLGGFMGKTSPQSWEVRIKKQLLEFEKKPLNFRE